MIINKKDSGKKFNSWEEYKEYLFTFPEEFNVLSSGIGNCFWVMSNRGRIWILGLQDVVADEDIETLVKDIKRIVSECTPEEIEVQLGEPLSIGRTEFEKHIFMILATDMQSVVRACL